jgi:hypothetical protein
MKAMVHSAFHIPSLFNPSTLDLNPYKKISSILAINNLNPPMKKSPAVR